MYVIKSTCIICLMECETLYRTIQCLSTEMVRNILENRLDNARGRDEWCQTADYCCSGHRLKLTTTFLNRHQSCLLKIKSDLDNCASLTLPWVSRVYFY